MRALSADSAKTLEGASATALGAAIDTPGPFAVVERLDGDADVEFWGRWRDGEMRHARARLDARELSLVAPAAPLGRGEADAAEADTGAENRTTSASATDGGRLLDELSADLVYTGEGAGRTLRADRIELAGAGERAVIDAVELGRDAAGEGWHVAARGERMPLALLAGAPSALLDTLAPASANALAALEPGGALLDWRSRVRLGASAPEDGSGTPSPRVSLSGEIEALSLGAFDRWPGVDSLDGSLDIVNNRGRLTLGGESFTLAREDVSLEVEAAEIVLDLDARIPGQARVDGRGALRRGALEAELRAGVTVARGRSPRIDAQGRYAMEDLSELPAWLALAGLPPAADRWFRRALVGGRAENGRLEWVGRLADFPYEGPEPTGTFRSTFDLVDGELAFLPGWPHARIPAGRLEFDGLGLRASNTAAGGLDALSVRSADVRIEDLRRPVLGLQISGGGALQSLIDFANEGPLASLLRPVLGRASGSGRAGLDLALDVPLYRGSGRSLSLDGSLFLDGNALTFARADLRFEGASGAVGFSESGVRVSNLRATLFGRPVTLDGESVGRGEGALTEIELGGAFEAADVLSHYGLPLDRFVRGASRWSVTLSAPHSAAKLRRDGVRLLARSDLVGTRLLLPAPLAKSSREAVPLTVSTAFRGEAPMTRWRIEHGDRFRAAADVDASGLHALGARFGGGPLSPPEARGVRLDGHAPALALDGWARALATLIEDLPAGEGQPEPILPVAASLSSDALIAGTRSLGPATLRVSSDEGSLNADIDNAHLAGSVSWPREHWRRELVATVRLRHLHHRVVEALGSAEEGEGGSGDSALDPRLLPAIEMSVARLVWDAVTLEEISLTALPVPLGTTFELSGELGDSATLRGNGTWRVRDAEVLDASRPGRHSSTLAIVLAGDDFGAALTRIGLPGVIAEGSGRVRAELAWRAPLYLPDMARASGSLAIDADRGRIVPLEPGAARLVGLFALQAIPRRLSLDFRDMTSDGLAFERIDGDIVLSGGVVETTLVQMTGPIGVIDVTGTSNLITREYDQEITVLPRVSAALPIIGMISGGMSAGIGVLVAGGFLKALGIDLDRIGLRRYALRGSWDEPRLEPLGGLPRRSP